MCKTKRFTYSLIRTGVGFLVAFIVLILCLLLLTLLPSTCSEKIIQVWSVTMLLIPLLAGLLTYNCIKKAQNENLIMQGFDSLYKPYSQWNIVKRILFYAAIGYIALILCILAAIFYYDGQSKSTGTIYSLTTVFVPILSCYLVHLYLKSHDRTTTTDKDIFNSLEPSCSLVKNISGDPPLPTMEIGRISARAYCSACGSIIQPNWTFCQHCGTPTAKVVDSVTLPVDSSASSSAFSKYGGVEADLLTIDLMKGHDFEYWTADMLRNLDFHNVEVTRGSGDQGVDVLAEKDGIKYAIQCKRYSSNLGNTPIQEVYAGKAIYHCQIAAVITNQYFTESARELAVATGTLLWDRDFIRNYLDNRKLAEKTFESCISGG